MFIQTQSQHTQSSLIDQYIQRLKPQVGFVKFKKLNFSDYVDKQLKHLVIQQKFNFQKISQLLTIMFPQYQDKLSPKHCAQRWAQIHFNRKYKINQKQNNKKQKKLQSIMAFEDPKKLFTAKQLISQLQIQQKKRKNNKNNQKIIQQHKGFNIINDSIRRKQTSKEYKQQQVQFLNALEKAKIIDEDMLQKPFLYRPKFIIDNPYELEKQDLTKQKAVQIMSQNLQVNNYVVGQFSKPQNIQILEYKSKFVHQKQQKKQNGRSHFIQQNWSDYESDSQTQI